MRVSVRLADEGKLTEPRRRQLSSSGISVLFKLSNSPGSRPLAVARLNKQGIEPIRDKGQWLQTSKEKQPAFP